MSTSTINSVTKILARALSLLEKYQEGTTGSRKLLRLLGWSLPQEIDDIGLAQLDISGIVDKINAVNLVLASNGSSIELDAKYADLIGAVGDFLSRLENIGNSFNAPPDFLSKTNIAQEFSTRLIDFLVTQLIAIDFPFFFALGTTLGIFEIVPYDSDESIHQSRHIRCVIQWARITRIFTDPKGLLRDIYHWGEANSDPSALVTALGSLLQVFSISNTTRQLPRRAEELIHGKSVPEADANPGIQIFVDFLKGLGVDPLAFGASIYGLRSTSVGTDAGIGITPYVHGTSEITTSLSPNLTFEFDSTVDIKSGIAIVFRAGSTPKIKYNLTDTSQNSEVPSGHVRAILHYRLPNDQKISILRIDDLAGLEASEIALSGGVDVSAGVLNPVIFVEIIGGRLFIDPSEMDSFLQDLMPTPIEVKFDFGIGWSSAYGFFIKGNASPSITIDLHDTFGPFTIDTLHVSLGVDSDNKLPLEISLSGKGQLGPLKVSVDRIGLSAGITFSRGNLGPLDLSISFKPPSGLGLELDAGLITGGGYLSIDSPNHRYAGVLDCSIADIVQVKIIGVLDTVLPDGSQGFSFLLVITSDLPPIQLGFGFTLNGVGGVGGVNRTMNQDALRDGFRAHRLDSVLFPQDPIENAPQIVSDLSSFFPPADGRYIFGPLFKIGWGTPTLLNFEIGAILEIPEPVRLVLLGEVKMALPTEDLALVELNIDILGVIDFGADLLTIQGLLYDSRVTVFSISGGMGLMLAWGDNANFACSVGGLNPRFQPPVNFPSLDRCIVSIGDGDNPRLSAQSYFAVTSNSLQFGANVDLYASAGGFSIHGWVGFDALFIFSPFSFVFDFSVGLDVEFDGVTLCSLQVDGMLAGPRPWHVHGHASFRILFVRISAELDLSWGDSDPVALPPTSVIEPLVKALGDNHSWSALLPVDATPAVSLAGTSLGDDHIFVHPLGMLQVREKIVPFEQTISRFGSARPSDGTYFTISSVLISGEQEDQQWLMDQFAIGQFSDLTDDQKLSAPSFQPMKGGIQIGSHDAVYSSEVSSVVSYRDGYIDNDDEVLRLKGVYLLPKSIHHAYSRMGAGFVSSIETKGVRQFTPPGTASMVKVHEVNYVIATVENISVRNDILNSPTTQYEAQNKLSEYISANPSERGALQVITLNEVQL